MIRQGDNTEAKEPQKSKFEVGMIARIQDPKTKRWDRIVVLLSRRKTGSWNVRDEESREKVRNERFLRRYYAPDKVMSKNVRFDDYKPKVEGRSLRKLPRKNYKE